MYPLGHKQIGYSLLAAVSALAMPAAMAVDYNVPCLPANIAPTAATAAKDHVEVIGEPRMSQGHPCTILDKIDFEECKKSIQTNKEAAAALATLRAGCDACMAKPFNVPIARKGPDGKWMYPGDFPENEPPFKKVSRTNEGNSSDMVSFGMLYNLTGEQKYGDYCKKMLMAYADNYLHYGHPPTWTERTYRSASNGRMTGQFLEDGFWLIEAAFAYDLVYNVPSWTPEERKHVRDDLFKPVASEFIDPIIGKPDYVSAQHNRSAICACGTLMAGYATEDQEMINHGAYGVGGSKEKPTGGMIGVHFTPECILPDGLWLEGAPGYQLGIASCALFDGAETFWHHGIDIYRSHEGAMKRLLDSALALAYPDAQMTGAALHDSGRTVLIGGADWWSNEVGVPYELGYRRYQDPRYIPIIQSAHKTFSMTTHAGGPSLFLDLPSRESATRPIENANFYAVGYGVLRVPAGNSANQVILEYGPSAGHAHPSKLAIDLYALEDAVMPFPGVIFPYQDPMDPKWYWTTVGNCVLSIDEQPQIYSGNRWKYPKNLHDPEASQLVFGPASTAGIERAWSTTVYPGITQDRAVFLTPLYFADLFGAFSDGHHKYDMAWHIRGKLTSDLKTVPLQFPEPVSPGYNGLTNVSHASTDKNWSATVLMPSGKPVRFFAPGGMATEVIFGTGHFKVGKVDDEPPTIIERRPDKSSVLFGNVADISGDGKGYVTSVAQEGGIEAGYGLLRIGTVKGTDLCFAAYRPGTYRNPGLETDAEQAFVSMDGHNVQTMYLGGGTSLKIVGAMIGRDTPGLAYVEKTKSGDYCIGNPSPTDATVTVTLPALTSASAVVVDEKGTQTGPAAVTKLSGAISIKLKANTKAEFRASSK